MKFPFYQHLNISTYGYESKKVFFLKTRRGNKTKQTKNILSNLIVENGTPEFCGIFCLSTDQTKKEWLQFILSIEGVFGFI